MKRSNALAPDVAASIVFREPIFSMQIDEQTLATLKTDTTVVPSRTTSLRANFKAHCGCRWYTTTPCRQVPTKNNLKSLEDPLCVAPAKPRMSQRSTCRSSMT
jgi:hypothetical protein